VTRQTLTHRLSGGRGPKGQAVVAATAIILVAVVIVVIVSAGSPSSSKGQSSASTATGATTVQRRDLVETDTESGTLGYANSQTVYNRLSGTITYLPDVGKVIKPGGTLYQVDGYPVILFSGSYPAYRELASGDSDGPDIKELNVDLKAMGFDPDDAITADDLWQTATTDAVERFQESIGQTQTGTLTLGQIVILPGPQLVNAVDTTLGSTGAGGGSGASDSSAGDSGSSNSADDSDPTASATPADYPIAGQPHAEFVDLSTSNATTPQSTADASTTATTPPCPGGPTTTTTTTSSAGCPPDTTPTTTTPAPSTTTPTTTPGGTSPLSGTPSSSALEAIVKLLETQNRLLQSELRSKGSSPTTAGKGTSGTAGATGAHSSASKGAGAASTGSTGAGSSTTGSGSSGASAGGSATPILTTSATNLVVTVDLDATKQSEAKLKEPVTVELPDGSTVNGKITAVSPIATSTSSGSSSSSPSASAPSATIPVTVSLEKHTDTRGLDQAAVSVNFEEQVANNVLSVPVTALLATQGGGYAVQEAAAPHKLIPVTPGLFAAGYVQISGPDVQDGMQVTDSQG
jgi:hypothetical protein